MMSLILSGQVLLTEEIVFLFLMWKLYCMVPEHSGRVVALIDCVQGVVVHYKSVIDARICGVQILLLHFYWLPIYFDVNFVFLR